VQLAVADTGPINYLILIGHIDVLPALFRRVILPAVVSDELKHQKAPVAVKQWIANPPAWAEVHPTPHLHDPSMEKLDAGEEDAIALAVELHADVILTDDRDGVRIARSRGFRVAGTLGILAMASTHGLLNLAEAFDRIKRTSFHYQQHIMDQFLVDPLRTEQ
jgi:predicted nucleic acid-binding protein